MGNIDKEFEAYWEKYDILNVMAESSKIHAKQGFIAGVKKAQKEIDELTLENHQLVKSYHLVANLLNKAKNKIKELKNEKANSKS
jgi:hypothetical protein